MLIKDINCKEINELQEMIMFFVDDWVHLKKTPVPHQEIIANLKTKGVKYFTVINALNSLLKKGYIRRAVVISNRTFYVQLRRV